MYTVDQLLYDEHSTLQYAVYCPSNIVGRAVFNVRRSTMYSVYCTAYDYAGRTATYIVVSRSSYVSRTIYDN